VEDEIKPYSVSRPKIRRCMAVTNRGG